MTQRAPKNDNGPALRRTFSGPIMRRSLAVAAIVGTALNAINQGPELLAGKPVDLAKLLLTYVVPFCVASYGAYAALRQQPRAAAPPAGP